MALTQYVPSISGSEPWAGGVVPSLPSRKFALRLATLALGLALTSGCAARFSNPIALKFGPLPGTPLPTGTDINFGPLAGGQTVTISGTDFKPGVTATIGGVACTSTTFINSTTIECVTPPMAAGTYPVVITNPNGLSSTVSGGYTYQGPPTVTAVALNYGPTAGGQLVTLTGTLFRPGIVASIDGFACIASSYTSATSMSCVTPVHAATGVFNVSVLNLDTQSGTLAASYSYVSAPTTVSASLDFGPVAGGQVVTVTGTGFLNQPGLTASVAGVPCSLTTYLSATSLLCTAPAGAAGTYAVAVTNGDGQSGAAGATYTYQGAPTYTGMNIDFGPPAGGVLITIDGTGFHPGIGVTIGGAACTGVVVVNSTTLTCTTPAGTTGNQNLVLTNADGQTSTAIGVYEYHGPPTVASANLNIGPGGGGQTITITGTLFEPGAVVNLGGTNCTTSTFVSATSLTCVTPAHALGAVTVRVTNLDGQFGNLVGGYTYVPAPDTTLASLNFGPLAGGQTITVTGTNFSSAPGLTASVGGVPCSTTTYVSPTSLTCVTPAAAAGTVNVSVTNGDGQTGTAGATFTYQGAPTYTGMNIDFGPMAGGVLITVSGTGFQPGISVTIGGAACTGVTVLNATTLTCTTPAGSAGNQNLVLTNADGQTSTAVGVYEYHGPPTVVSTNLNYGPGAGGQTITITGTLFEPGLTASLGGTNCATSTYVSATSMTCVTPAHALGAVTVVVTNLDGQSGNLASGYTFADAPTTTAATLGFGPVAGGQSITVTGTGFRTGITATVNGVTCTSPVFGSSTSMTCVTPAQGAGTYTVAVTNPDGQSGTASATFTYQGAPTFSSMNIDFGPPAGGVPITITGTGFQPGITVTIGGAVCTSVVVVNATTLTCTTPPGATGSQNIVLTNADGQTSTAVGAYRYHGPPTIASILPTSGPAIGGTSVTFTGTLFEPGLILRVGGTNCTTSTYVSPTQATCVTPAQAPGVYLVGAVNLDGQSGTLPAAFTYLAAPTISSISPVYGPLAGGTPVTLTGTLYQAGATVTINGVACTSVVVVNATTITCNTPVAQPAGSYNVVVTNPDAQTGTLVAGYTYQGPPTVTSVSLPYGPLAGGQSITITGTNFRTGITATINGAACTSPVFGGPTTMTCTTPAQPVGSYTVAVTNTDGQSGSLSNGYRYHGAPTVSSINLNFGPLAGGQTITINGTLFETGITVAIGGTACTSLIYLGPTQITCTTPAKAAGPYTVLVTNTDTQNVSVPSGYTYQGAPTVGAVNLNFGPLAGGQTITLTGTNFRPAITATVNGSACTTPTYVNATTMTCVTPAQSAGTYAVAVTNADTQTGSLAASYTYTGPPTISSVSLNYGPLAGGQTITITGTGFRTGLTALVNSVTCTSPTFVNATTATCVTPAQGAGTYGVQVLNADSQVGSLASAYTYQGPPTVSSTAPTSGPAIGGTSITVTGTNFRPGLTGRINAINCASSTYISATSMTCVTPAGTAGARPVTVLNTDGQSGGGANFTYIAAPTVSSLSPNFGPLAGGGAAVTITGSGFQSGLTITLGGATCTSPTFVNANTATCTRPARPAGTYTATVTNPDTQNGTGGSYTYTGPPTVTTSASPSSGPTTGGTNITITGTNFFPGITATVNGGSCSSPNYVSSTQMTCNTPASGAGAVTIAVTNTDGQTGNRASSYTYMTPANLVWTETTYSYGTVAVDTTHVFTLQNTGQTTSGSIGSAFVTGGQSFAFTKTVDNCQFTALTSMATCTVSLRFNASSNSAGAYSTTLRTSATPGGTADSTVSGTIPVPCTPGSNIFTGAGSFTQPVSCNTLRIEIWGGGGGGAGSCYQTTSIDSGGGGGGGGGYATNVFSVTPGTVINSWSIGAGGGGGSVPPGPFSFGCGTNGGGGGGSSIGAPYNLSASGGFGGFVGIINSTGGRGGNGSTGAAGGDFGGMNGNAGTANATGGGGGGQGGFNGGGGGGGTGGSGTNGGGGGGGSTGLGGGGGGGGGGGTTAGGNGGNGGALGAETGGIGQAGGGGGGGGGNQNNSWGGAGAAGGSGRIKFSYSP